MAANTIPTTSTNEPQTAEYQAAVDNVWFEQERAAKQLRNQWFRKAEDRHLSRIDYVVGVEMEMRTELRKALDYELNS